ncbi:MAG: hypothetical protein PGN12_09400 [Sphingomonas phyllosphaerae]
MAVALSVALAGCAGNAIVLDRGQDVSVAGAAAARDVRAYLDRVQQQNLATNVALVASDPGCEWGDKIRIAVRDRFVTGEMVRSMCLARGAPVPPGYSAFDLPIAPISKRTLEPTLALVVAMSEYLEILDTILQVKTPDVAKDVAELKGHIADARTTAQAVGVQLPELKSLSDAQVKAATDLLQLATDLSVEQAKARRLRRLEADNAGRLDTVVASLKAQIMEWQTVWAKPDLQHAAQAYAIAERAPWRPQDFESRRVLIVGLVEARRAADSADALGAALTGSLDRVLDAQRDLRRVLAGKFNEKEKRERAALVRKRLWRAFTAVGAIVSAF